MIVQEKNFWNDVESSGVNSIINQKKNEIRNIILSFYPCLVKDNLLSLSISVQKDIVEEILKTNPSLFFEDNFWKSFIEDSLAKFENEDSSYFLNYGAWYVLLNRIKNLKEKVDWFDVLLKLSNATAVNSDVAPGFEIVLNWLTSANKENLRKLMYRTETKSYPKNLRATLYTRLIELGLLDTKMARRIRSDSSGRVSRHALAYLFEKRSMYEEDDFKSLITNFCDTKHPWPARYIAMNMPVNLLPFLLGIEDSLAKKIIEKRLEALNG